LIPVVGGLKNLGKVNKIVKVIKKVDNVVPNKTSVLKTLAKKPSTVKSNSAEIMFNSTDKYVGQTANAIEAKYPGNVGNLVKNIGTPIKGTSYDINKLYKTQPSKWTNRGTVINMKDSILESGSNAVPPIPVRVHKGQALIVDGHHRFQAFSELGYNRVPIKYIHENQIKNYGRTLKDLLDGMYK
jgi:hypothetical protein